MEIVDREELFCVVDGRYHPLCREFETFERLKSDLSSTNNTFQNFHSIWFDDQN